MQTFNLFIGTPEKIIYQNDIVAAIFPGVDGFFEILAHHAPIIALIKSGSVKIVNKEQTEEFAIITEGFFEFYQNKGILLCLSPAEQDLK